METTAQTMERLLRAEFAPVALSIADDSAKHAGHAGAQPGGQTHFTVNIVSDAFVGMRSVVRHRAVYAVLGPLFDAGLHALAIHAKTTQEARSA